MTKPLATIRPKDISIIENCSINQAYRKFRQYRLRLGLRNRKFITINELAHLLELTLPADIDELRLKCVAAR